MFYAIKIFIYVVFSSLILLLYCLHYCAISYREIMVFVAQSKHVET